MRITRFPAIFVAALALGISACDEAVTTPDGFTGSGHATAMQVAQGTASYCLPNPDRVVRTLDELADANEHSGPGTRIAIDGMIAMEAGFTMRYDNMVLTCATPGSGIAAVPGSGVWSLIEMRASHDTVSGLVLDATASYPYTVFATMDPGAESFAVAPVIQGNVLTCHAGPCIWVAAGTFGEGQGATIRDNSITVLATGPDTAIQVQGWSDVRIEHNTFVATGAADHGLILNGDTRVTVTGNQFSGDWIQGVAAVDGTTAGVLQGNWLTGTLDAFVFVDVDSMTVDDNDILCGSRTCGLVHGGPHTFIRHNRATSHGSLTGLHIQLWTDGSLIEDNEVVATAPSTSPDLGGIRAQGGSGVIVRRNKVSGPWQNGLALAWLDAPVVSGNEVQGAIRFGALTFTDRGTYTGNRLFGGSEAGLGVGFGCYNTFRGNMLRPDAGAPAAFFDVLTGGNIYEGAGTTVVDNGDFDCDDQNGIDPNRITGARVPGHPLGLKPPSAELGQEPR